MIIAFDCRWLGRTGIGRMTEHLLQGLRVVRPPGTWLLWGPDEVARWAWPGTHHVVAPRSPLAWGGQRDVLRLPRADLLIHPHTVRPIAPWRRTAVIVNDVIPAVYDDLAWRRAAWRRYLAVSVRTATAVVAISDATVARMHDVLGVRPENGTRVIRPAVGSGLASRVRERRRASSAPTRLLYVGQFKRHKNLERAIAGFARSTFAAQGGRFTLVGGAGDSVDDLRRVALASGMNAIEVIGRCSDDELIGLYADAVAVIMPSLEEGFGLPVVEALLAGIPVCCSDIPVVKVVGRDVVEVLDPLSPHDIASSIDRTVALAGTDEWTRRLDVFARRDVVRTPEQFARDLLRALDLPDAR